MFTIRPSSANRLVDPEKVSSCSPTVSSVIGNRKILVLDPGLSFFHSQWSVSGPQGVHTGGTWSAIQVYNKRTGGSIGLPFGQYSWPRMQPVKEVVLIGS